jgi:hypothetical protein
MWRLTLMLLVSVAALLSAAVMSPASAYVWRCHTPSGDVWTDQAPQSGDCEEYDGVFNPKVAPPVQTPPSPQPAPPYVVQTPVPVPSVPAPAPPVYYPAPYSYAYPYPYPYPVPYPYAYYPYYPRYYGSGLYLGFPGLAFDFRFGGGHFGHGFRGGRHFGGGRGFGRHR